MHSKSPIKRSACCESTLAAVNAGNLVGFWCDAGAHRIFSGRPKRKYDLFDGTRTFQWRLNVSEMQCALKMGQNGNAFDRSAFDIAHLVNCRHEIIISIIQISTAKSDLSWTCNWLSKAFHINDNHKFEATNSKWFSIYGKTSLPW